MRLNFKKLALLGGPVARGTAALVGLTPARLDFLAVLRAGPLCQREIAEKLCVSEAVVSVMVRALVALRLVERMRCVKDARYRVVSLTEEGCRRYERLTDCEWLLHPHGRDCAQNVGERNWLNTFQEPLRKLELAGLFVIDQHDEQPASAEPPYAVMRHHARTTNWRQPIDGEPDAMELVWPKALPPRPPIEGGLVPL